MGKPYPKRLVGVVWQDDLLIPSLTVCETIEFAYKLETPSNLSSHIPQYVDKAIHDLGLESVEHSLVGVSGGPPEFNRKKGGDDNTLLSFLKL